MVKTLHEVGIEVILDVVYNHTAEGDHLGPTVAFRGVDNAAYYRLTEPDRRYYVDFTGTGNTLNVRHPHSLPLITRRSTSLPHTNLVGGLGPRSRL